MNERYRHIAQTLAQRLAEGQAEPSARAVSTEFQIGQSQAYPVIDRAYEIFTMWQLSHFARPALQVAA